MVESIANISLETLRDLVVEGIRSLWGVDGDVEQVERELRSIHASLKNADREKRDSPTLKECVAQLRDLAIRAENVLERYAVEVKWKKEEGRSFKEKFQKLNEWTSLHKLGGEARDIVSRFADLRQRLESEYGQQSSPHEDERQRLLRQTYAHQVERHFVGMEKDIENLVSMVKDDDETRYIKIYGMGGLGKTTLARKIYNHAEFVRYARAWVCITQQLQPHAALSTILKQLDGSVKTNEMDVAELVERIHGILNREEVKSLIVIDDIWENKDWEIIRPAFPINSNCNVLITTRNRKIGNYECCDYKLEFLTENQGWDLLQKIALNHLNPPPDGKSLKSLEKIGRQIVVKCGRLPLSISVIGGILRQQQVISEEHWDKVNTNMDSYLRHEGDGVTEENRVEQVLGLSYDSLPYYLKPCFLYLACFREDEEIDTERLYLLWMAEGFVSHQDKGSNETLMDVAERYLTELVMRCMVQVVDMDDTKFSSCRLHDLMHKLCSSKVDEGDKFLERVDLITRNLNGIPSSDSTSTDRSATPLSIGNSSSRLVITVDDLTAGLSIEGLEKVKNLRCLVFFKNRFGCRAKKLQLEDSTIDLSKSPCLRTLVLDFCEFKGEKLPRKVRKLIHLRYLSLGYTNVRELPVWPLPYLHTLNLQTFSSIRVPNVIWKMKRLRHLFLDCDRIELIGGEKLRLDGLLELEILDDISSKIACVADIPKLINLRILCIEICDMESFALVARHMNLGNNRLRETYFTVKLEFDFGLSSAEIDRDAIKNLLMSPSLVFLNFERCNIGDGFQYYEKGMCKNLVCLNLTACEVGGDVMEELGKYPVLQILYLDKVKFGTTETLIFPSNSFPQLKYLPMYLLNVEELQVEETTMPKLTYFVIESTKDSGSSISVQVPREFEERVRGQGTAIIYHRAEDMMRYDELTTASETDDLTDIDDVSATV